MKEQVKRFFALGARLLADDGREHAVPQELFCRVCFVEGDHAQFSGEPERRYGTAPAVDAAGSKKQRIGLRIFFNSRRVCS